MGLFFWRKSKTQVSERVIIDLSLGATLEDDYHLPEPFENESILMNQSSDITIEHAETSSEKLETQHPVELIKKAYNTKDWPTFFELAKARILIEQERDVHIYLIRAYYVNKEWAACASICHSLLSFESNDIDAYRFLARCANNNLELDTAIEYYLKIIEIVPFESDSLVSLIRIYYDAGNHQQVIEYAKIMIQEYPAVKEGHVFLYRAFHSLQKFELAIPPLEALLEMNPNDLDALLPLIRIYYNMNNYHNVIKYAKIMIQEYPAVREGHLFMARSSMVLGKNQQSLKALLQLLVMDENDIEALVTIGKALHNLERYNDAMGYFERALAIDPDERRSRRTLALIYDRLGKSEQALDLYTKECIFQPLAFSNWEKKINLLYRLNREQKALDCIPELLELGNSNLESYLLANEIALSFFWNKMSKDLLKHSYEKWGNEDDFFEKIALSSILSGNLSTTSKNISKGLQKTPKRKELMELQKRLQQILDETNTPRKMLKEAISNGEMLLEMECHIMNLIKEASKIKPYSITEAKSNVLMVSSSLGRGGAERQVVSSLHGLLKDPKFEETKLYCYSISGSRGHGETYETEIRNIGVRIHEFGKRIDWNAGIKDAEILLEPWKKYLEKLPVRMQRDIEPLFLNFHHERPQIVHAWQDQTNINASIAALMAGVPGIVMFARSMRPDGKTMMHIRNRPYLRSAYQTLFEHSPRVLLCHNSSAGARSYSQWLGCPEDDFEVIHNGVDFTGIEKASEGYSMSGILHIPKKSIVIGGVFRLVTEKRPKLWVEAISKVLDVKENVLAVHVGGGSHSEFIQDYVNELGLGDKIHLIGQTKQVKAWLDEFDLFLLTSIVEGLPNVLIEAQAFGVPVVSTDAGGAKDTFIDGETGVLVTEPTADELANAILKCLNDPEWMEIAKINSRINARKRFSQESMLKRLKEIYTFSLQRT